MLKRNTYYGGHNDEALVIKLIPGRQHILWGLFDGDMFFLRKEEYESYNVDSDKQEYVFKLKPIPATVIAASEIRKLLES